MKRTYLCLASISVAVSLAGAEYSLPPSRQPAANTWQKAGVKGSSYGGIVNRTEIHKNAQDTWTIASTGDATDRRAEIQNAINSCPVEKVVLLGPGDFYCNGGLTFGTNRSNRTLRGSVDANGLPISRIIFMTDHGLVFGDGGHTWIDDANPVTVADLTKGATSFTLAHTSNLAIGQMIQLRLGNDPTIPIWDVYGQELLRRQHFIISNISGNTVTVESPCIGDYSGAPSAFLWRTNANLPKGRGMGVESLILAGPPTMALFVNMSELYGSWMTNVTIENFHRRAILIYNCLNSEIRECYLGGVLQVSTSNGGITIQPGATSCLFEGNVVLEVFPGFELTQGAVGNVIGYNFVHSESKDSFTMLSTNHGGFNSFNLYEGNITRNAHTDGYFGGVAWDVLFRNWLMGRPVSDQKSGYTTSLNRGTRNYSLVGNVLGKTGVGTVAYSMGNPNLVGAPRTLEYAQPSADDWWYDWDVNNGRPKRWEIRLTSRTTDTAGILTVAPGKGADIQGHINRAFQPDCLMIRSWDGQTGNLRITPTGVTGDTISFINANQILPIEDTIGVMWPGEYGFQEQDLDVQETTILVSNYHGGATNHIPAEETITDTLPQSFYLTSKPPFFRGLAWPPIDPNSPPIVAEQSYAVIPAGYRYVHGVPPPNSPPDAPSGLIATTFSPSEVHLAWADNSVDETHFKIHRGLSSASLQLRYIAGNNATTYSDFDVSPASTYYYAVQASNSLGDSNLSNIVSATTSAGSPSAPNLHVGGVLTVETLIIP